jgi:NTP pyrophosphatase (non-canonical NTP hydrolase)
MKIEYWSLGCDILGGPKDRAVKIATAQMPEIAKEIAEAMNTTTRDHRTKSVTDILAERTRQDSKWGQQNHDPITWSAILTEECGEFAQAALHHRFGGPAAEGLRVEAVQVAAVALAIVECLDRNTGKVGCALCDRGDGQLGHSDNCPRRS